MDRKEFLVSLGKGAAFITLATCLGDCSNNNPAAPNPPQNVDLTLDLSMAENSALNSAGGFVYKSGIIIANTGNNNFAAVSQACTHQGYTLVYQQSGNKFHCNNHGSNFSTSGAVINGPASQALGVYHTQLNGNMLRVYS